jgi:integrase
MGRADRDELVAARKLASGVPLVAAMEEWALARQMTTGHVLAAAKMWATKLGKVEKRLTVTEVVTQFIKAKKAAGKQVEKDQKSTLARIKLDLGHFSIDAVSVRQLQQWLSNWSHPLTRNTIRKRIVAIWRWAARQSYLPRDAKTEAELTDAAHAPASVIGIIDVSTWSRLLAYFRAEHPEFLAPLVVAGFCGLRRGEVHAQTWEDISTERRNLRVTGAKRGTPARRMVPLCEAAVAWLNVCAGDHKAEVCFDYAMDRVRALAREAVNEDKTPMFPALPDNVFRHSYISHACAGTGNIPRVSLDAGNSPGQVNRYYRELVTEADGKAWFAVLPA